MLCVFFQSTEARGWGQWTQVPLECSLQEGSVACLAGASTARLRSCLHSLFLFGLADLQSSQWGPEPSRTSLSLLERPSSLVNSPLSRYIGLIKGKYFNNTENGHWYSAVGGKKACSKTVCYLILFCKTKPNKHHKNTNTYSKEKDEKYMHQILLLAFWMIGDFNFLHFTYLFYSDFYSRHGFFLIRKKKRQILSNK